MRLHPDHRSPKDHILLPYILLQLFIHSFHMNAICVNRIINFKNEFCVGLRQGGGNKTAQAKKKSTTIPATHGTSVASV